MTHSKINWKLPRYIVGACWLISFVLYAIGKAIHFPVNPIPKAAAAIFGGLVHGYVGAGRPYEPVMVIVYATLVGLVLSWLFQSSKLNPAALIGIAIVIHIVLSVLSLPLLMLAGGR